MTADVDLDRLERLARLRDAGALTVEEFEREKAALLQRDRANDASALADVLPTQPEVGVPVAATARRRWPLWLLAGAVLASGGGLALANWTGNDLAPAETNTTNPAQANKPKPTSASAIRALPADRQVELALQAVFGQGPRELRLSEDVTYTYGKGQVIWAGSRPILIVEGNGESYPAAVGTLGLFYLREQPDGTFAEVRRWPDAVSGSMMGNPPEWKIRTDIADEPVIESDAGGVWQGYACRSTSLTELGIDGPKALATFDSHYDSTGAVGDGGESYQGAIAKVVRDRSFEVRFTGTRALTQRFVRKGATYVRVPAAGEELNESAIPTC